MYTKSHISHTHYVATALASSARLLAGLLARQALVGQAQMRPDELDAQQAHWEAVQREFAQLTEELTPHPAPEAA